MNTWQRSDVQWLRTGAQEWKPASLVLLPAVLCTLSRYVGSAEFAARAFPSAGRGGELLYLFAATFLLFGLAPAAVVRFAFGESLCPDAVAVIS